MILFNFQIPGMMVSLQQSEYDWKFHAKSNYACKAFNNGCYWPAGKMLGGSSSLNFMLYLRGIKRDFDYWAQLGNLGWDYESVLPYFKKSEGNLHSPFVENQRYHSGIGPVKIDFSINDGSQAFRKLFTDAAVERGNRIIADINADEELGYVRSQGTYGYGRRQSAAKAFLIPAKGRSNLHIIKHAFVEKILINAHNVAYGVQFRYKGQYVFQVIARKEVILSAGTVMSPHLLMLSGIGPRNILERHFIPVKSDLPVGNNLLDHVYSFAWFKFNPTETPSSLPLDNMYQYLMHGSGPLTSIGVSQLIGFINTVNGTGSPDFEIFFFYFPKNSPDFRTLLEKFDYKEEIKHQFLYLNRFYDIAAVASSLLRPKSRGCVKITSSSPYQKPIIRPEFFLNPDDMEAMLRAIKLQISYENTDSYKKAGGEFLHIPIRNCERYLFRSDNYYRCYIQYFSSTNFHPVGTSKMGPHTDPQAVVDSHLRVRNIRNLRQIDAGVLVS